MFLLGTTPGYQKVFHEVMFPHHPIITPSLTAPFFPDLVTSQPSPPQGSLTIAPQMGATKCSSPPNHPGSPYIPFTGEGLQWEAELDCLVLTVRGRNLADERASKWWHLHRTCPCMLVLALRLALGCPGPVKYKAKDFRARSEDQQNMGFTPMKSLETFAYARWIETRPNVHLPHLLSCCDTWYVLSPVHIGSSRREKRQEQLSYWLKSDIFWSNRYNSRAQPGEVLFTGLRNWVCDTCWTPASTAPRSKQE